MRELSIFIDESGDFGDSFDRRDYYLVTFVFHDQSDDITDEIRKLDETVRNLDLNVEYIHAGPIIRKEGIFENYTLDERRSLIYKIFNFAFKAPVYYYTISVKRKEAADKV